MSTRFFASLNSAGFAQIFDLPNKPESAVIYMLALIVLALVSGGFLIWLAVKEGEEKRRQKARYCEADVKCAIVDKVTKEKSR